MIIAILVLLALILVYSRSIAISLAVIAQSYKLWEKSLDGGEEKNE